MILLIVVTMMQVVCCDKQTKKESKKKRKKMKSRPFCTGCLYVWEEILKINADTVVNTQREKLWSLFFYYFLYMFIKEENLRIKILKTGVKGVGGWILY